MLIRKRSASGMQRLNFKIGAVVSGIVFLSYFAWEIYWISRQGFPAIRWHTHLILYVFIMYILFLFGCFMRSTSCGLWINRFLLVFSSVLFSLMMAEGFLYFLNIGKSATELNGWGYKSVYELKGVEQSHRWTADTFHSLKSPEFSFLRKTNSLGFSDTADWNRPALPGHVRILTLGDSFTEGDGAAFDSSYVNQLRVLLKEKGVAAEVFNAGVCGSDPVYNFKDFMDTLYALRPDVIIQTISSGDVIADLLGRGGLERFREGQERTGSEIPWRDKLRSVSLLFRLYEKGRIRLFGQPDADTMEEQAVALEKLNALVRVYADETRRRGICLLLVLQPHRLEVEAGIYDVNLLPAAEEWKSKSGVAVIDLQAYFRKMTIHRKSEIRRLYWPQNGHHNGDGYKWMATGILKGLEENNMLMPDACQRFSGKE